jgi:hypothetical protein
MALFDELVEFVNEREQVRLNKDSGYLQPYTLDPILAKYRFCNVRRRDDRVSQWLIKNYYRSVSGDVWFRALLARLINWPPTLLYLMDKLVIPHRAEDFNAYLFIEAMKELESKGEKVYSSAYIVYPTMVKGNTKSVNLCEYIIKPTISMASKMRGAVASGSIKYTTNQLAEAFGIQTFIAGQVSADLTYLRGQLDNAIDLYSWAPMGPGSRRGLNRLHERKLLKTTTEKQFNQELIEVRETVIGSNQSFKDLTLHDYQNIMCEFDKYQRVKTGEGKPRQNYKPTKEF